ncbi:hypothetical protein L6V77_27330 [Myxococcota bacterium]|nr:hypothetical protein [Myxococcota bacterium]
MARPLSISPLAATTVLTLATIAATATAAAADPAKHAPAAPAPVAAPDAATGERLLAAVDVPLTAELIARTGLTEATAVRLLGDTTQRRYLRLRALSSLPFFATPTARALVEATLARDADEVVRIQAATSLARGFGGADPVGVATHLQQASRGATPAVAEAITAELALLQPRLPAPGREPGPTTGVPAP